MVYLFIRNTVIRYTLAQVPLRRAVLYGRAPAVHVGSVRDLQCVREICLSKAIFSL